MVFKGGTSLSKVWKLIQRFSEDIDLAIDRAFLGFDGELSRSRTTALRKMAGKYTTGPFFEALQNSFSQRGFEGLTLDIVPATDGDQDPRIIEVHYPNIIRPPGYLDPKVQIEIGCRSLREPYTISTVDSLVDEIYREQNFAAPPIDIPTVNAERTFLEKLFLLHEEFHLPEDKIRVDRLSRHLYDVHHLSKTDVAARAIQDKDLYQTIVSHRYKFSRVGNVDYNSLAPKNINPVPPENMLAAWSRDYKRMQEEMIYEEKAPSFDHLIDSLERLKERLKTLNWNFTLEFP